MAGAGYPNFYVAQIPLMGVTVNETKVANLRRRGWARDRAGHERRRQVTSRAAGARGRSSRTRRASSSPTPRRCSSTCTAAPKTDPRAGRRRKRRAARSSGISDPPITKGPLVFKTQRQDEGRPPEDSVVVPAAAAGVLHLRVACIEAIDAAYASAQGAGPGLRDAPRRRPGGAPLRPQHLAPLGRDGRAGGVSRRSGASKEDVDLHMGWQLRKHAKEMRLHYADRGARACRARMTEMI